jgi:predicted nucleic acid-binding protein
MVLDTNVISELIRPQPAPSVLAFVDALDMSDFGITAVTAAELLYGVERLPPGRRRTELTQAVNATIEEDFDGRVEPFDAASAVYYAVLVTDREKAGRPISTADAQIASICRKLRASLATRNTKDFEGTGVTVVDPWQLSEHR